MMKNKYFWVFSIIFLFFLVCFSPALAYNSCAEVPSEALNEGGITRTCQEVTACGTLLAANTYYLLTRNISSPYSCITLRGAHAILDLNGYEVRYADVGFDGVYNFDFEMPGASGSEAAGWDLSSAPHADRVKDNYYWLSRDYLIKWVDGASPETIYSDWVSPNVSGIQMSGYAIFHACPSGYLLEVESQSAGIVCSSSENLFCSFTSTAGENYRLRLTSNSGTCYVDYADIRPGNYGSGPRGILIQTSAIGVNAPKKIRNGKVTEAGQGAFFGVAIRNEDAYSTNFLMENVVSFSSGLDSSNFETGSQVNYTYLRNNIFINNNTQSTNRHLFMGPVELYRSSYNQVYNNTFLGGQGGVMMDCNNRSDTQCFGTEISYNKFYTSPGISNHYSISAWHTINLSIHHNEFVHQGPGIILTGESSYHFGGAKIYNNFFNLTSMPCNSEYPTGYSNSAIRITDYLNGVAFNENNSIYNNVIYVHANYFPDYPSCIPKAYGWHNSVSGKGNEFVNNTVYVTSESPGIAMVVYSTSYEEGLHKNNNYSSDYWGAWLGNDYGYNMNCKNSFFDSNTFKQIGNYAGYHSIVFGGDGGDVVTNHTFLNNTFYRSSGLSQIDTYPLVLSGNGGEHDYTLKWYLEVEARSAGMPLAGKNIVINSVQPDEDMVVVTDSNGRVIVPLTEYYAFCPSNRNCPALYAYTNYTPHNISVTHDGETKEVSVVMNESKKIIFDFSSPGCVLPFDEPVCGCIDNTDLLETITAWFNNQITISGLMANIKDWKECN